jgi:mannose-6-phosphate isomerase-like protein (cupin superfamily)
MNMTNVPTMTRRGLWRLVPAALVARFVPQAFGESTSNSLPSQTLPFERLAVHGTHGNQFRDLFKGKLATGEAIETHETTLPVAGAPHPPHRHEHSEMWFVRRGTVEITIEGKSHRLGPGSAAFVASNELHGIRNAGSVPATYFVVAVGPGADRAPATNPPQVLGPKS